MRATEYRKASIFKKQQVAGNKRRGEWRADNGRDAGYSRLREAEIKVGKPVTFEAENGSHGGGLPFVMNSD